MDILFWDNVKQGWVKPAVGETISASYLPAGGAAPRYAAAVSVVATNTNIVAAPGAAYSLPAGTLTVNRTIDVSALNTDNDLIEIDNQEAGFTWSFTGQTVYDGYEGSVTTLLANTRYSLRRTNGKLKIIN